MTFFRAAGHCDALGHMLQAMAGFGGAPGSVPLALNYDFSILDSGFVSEAFVRGWFGSHWSVVGS